MKKLLFAALLVAMLCGCASAQSWALGWPLWASGDDMSISPTVASGSAYGDCYLDSVDQGTGEGISVAVCVTCEGGWSLNEADAQTDVGGAAVTGNIQSTDGEFGATLAYGWGMAACNAPNDSYVSDNSSFLCPLLYYWMY